MLRRIASRGVPSVGRKAFAAPTLRTMSTLTEKERGEEAKYFNAESQKQIAAMKAKLEKIAESDDASLKEELVELLDKVDKPKEEGSPMLKKLGLDTWHAQVAAATGLAIPLLINEVICIEIEMLLLPPFFYYCSQVYTHVMPGIYASVNESIEEQKAEYENMESAEYSGHFESLDTYKSYVSLEDDMKTLYATVDELSAQQSEALISKAKFDFRDSMAKKLDSLVALEDAAALNIKQRMLKDVKASVEATLSTDKKIKDDALKQAISILAGGSKATRGKDIVGEAFNGALKKYRDDYSKGDPSKDPIVVQLMADAKAIAANA